MAKKSSVWNTVKNAFSKPTIGGSIGSAIGGSYGGVPGMIAGSYFGSKLQNKLTQPKKGSTSPNNSPVTAPAYDYSAYKGSTSSGGSYSASGTKWYDVAKADISGLLKAYEDEATSARQTAESNYNITRNDLLTQLKRYQEENARNVQTQKQNYLSEQANLESARESANRQSRISAAARGLAGSGLQQLAQLQNLIGQSEKVSEAAGKNQTAMDKLATALREYTEDNETKLSNALIQKNNVLNTIASTLSKQKAQAIAENEQAYTNAVNARNAAMAQYSYSSSPGSSESYDYTDAVKGGLTGMEKTLSAALKSASNLKKKKQGAAVEAARANALASLDDLNTTYGLGGNYNAAVQTINNLLKKSGFGNYTI